MFSENSAWLFRPVLVGGIIVAYEYFNGRGQPMMTHLKVGALGAGASLASGYLGNMLPLPDFIEAMGEKNVNPGFGMHPTPNKPYSIWKYKGGGLLSASHVGGTCKHYWIRETYRKRADVNNPLAETITPAEARKAGEILPTNNPKAYIAPHDM